MTRRVFVGICVKGLC